MAIRVTSNMISGEYKSQINNTLSQLEYYTKRANSLRNFSKFSEDPLIASKAMRLRRSYTMNQDYLKNISSIGDTYSLAESAAMDVKDILDQAADVLRGASNFGTFSKDNYATYANTLRGLQKDILTTMNSKLNDSYVFGGANAVDIPFNVDANGKLVFRGVDVDTGDAAALKDLASESVYVDVGLGVKVDKDGNVDTASVFNDTMNGLEFFGYGQEADGTSKNVYNLLGQAADAIEKYLAGDENAFNTDVAKKFIGSVSDATTKVLISTSNLGIKSNQLEGIKTRLDQTQEDLTEQLHNMEYINAEEAYTDLTWQRKVYEASLQIGSKLLQTTFLDYMR